MRNRIIIRSIVLVFVVAVFMIAGCAPTKVKMKRETVDWQQEKAMAQRALERFDEGAFNVYVYEWRPGIVVAIVVDLKNDDLNIQPTPDWRKINTRQEFEQAINAGGGPIKASGAKLYRIEGDDGEIWGFFFAGKNFLPYTVIDDKTIQLGNIPIPSTPGP